LVPPRGEDFEALQDHVFGLVQPLSLPVNFTPDNFRLSIHGMPAITSTRSAPPTPIAHASAAAWRWLSVPS